MEVNRLMVWNNFLSIFILIWHKTLFMCSYKSHIINIKISGWVLWNLVWILWHYRHPSLHIFNSVPQKHKNRVRVVSIATGYGLHDPGFGVRAPVGARIFTSPCRPDQLWGPPNFLSNGYQGFFPGVKWHGGEADHTPPSSAEVKEVWIFTSTPPCAFVA
jgi:hypothetical protein